MHNAILQINWDTCLEREFMRGSLEFWRYKQVRLWVRQFASTRSLNRFTLLDGWLGLQLSYSSDLLIKRIRKLATMLKKRRV